MGDEVDKYIIILKPAYLLKDIQDYKLASIKPVEELDYVDKFYDMAL